MKDKPDPSNLEYQLSQALDGQLADRQADSLRSRLAEDDDLAAQQRLYQSVNAQLDELAHESDLFDQNLLDAQRQEIMSRLERRVLLEGPTRRHRRFPVVFWPVGLAAAAMLIAGLSLLYNIVLNQADTTERQIVQVRMHAPETLADRPTLVQVSARRGVDMEMMALAPDSPPASDVPEGTVVFSIGRASPPSKRPEGLYPL